MAQEVRPPLSRVRTLELQRGEEYPYKTSGFEKSDTRSSQIVNKWVPVQNSTEFSRLVSSETVYIGR